MGPDPKGGVPALFGYAGEYGIRKGFQGVYGDSYREPPGIAQSFSSWWSTMNDRKTWLGAAANDGFSFREHSKIDVPDRPVRIDSTSIAEMSTPRGTQDVRVTNQQPFNLTVNASIVNNGVSDPKAAADATLSHIGQEVKNATEALFSD